jgi:tetratricopeptide (TPR) repeat protein
MKNVISYIKAREEFFALLLIGIATFGVYLNAVGNEFVFDDHLMITARPVIQSLSNIDYILKDYRPFRGLIQMIEFHYFGLNPVGYHLVNILLHLLTGITVLAVIKQLTGQLSLGFLTAIVFALHPIQTDAVTYISGLRDVLAGFFYVLGFWLFLIYRQTERIKFLLMALGSYGLGVLSKEVAITLVAMFFAYDLFSELNTSMEADMKWGKRLYKGVAQTFVRHKYFYLGFILLAIAAVYYYVVIKHASGRIIGSKIGWWGGSVVLNYLTASKVMLYYLKQLFFPIHLLEDYMGIGIVAKSPFQISGVLSFIGVCAYLYVAVRLFSQRSFAGFALCWFFIGLAPALQFIPHHELMAEHYLYIPSVGFAFFLALMIDGLHKKYQSETATKMIYAGVAIVLILYATRTVVRNRDWRNDLSLVTKHLAVFPVAPRANLELGYLYLRMNLLEAADEALKRSLDQSPGYALVFNNLGVLHSRLLEFDAAISYFKDANRQAPPFNAQAVSNLGINYMIVGKKEEGYATLLQARELDPINENTLVALYYASMARKDYDAAARFIKEKIEFMPKDIDSYFKWANALNRSLKFPEAIKTYHRILELDPSNKAAQESLKEAEKNLDRYAEIQRLTEEGGSDASVHSIQGQLFFSIGDLEAARKAFELALNKKPDDAELLERLSDVLESSGLYEQAIPYLSRLAQIKKTDSKAHFRLAKLYTVTMRFDETTRHLKMISGNDRNELKVSELLNTVSVLKPRYDEAQKLLKTGRRGQADYLLASIFKELGLLEKAKENYLKAAEDPGTVAQANYQLGLIYLDQFKMAEAVKQFKKVIALDKAFVAAYNQLALVYFNTVKDYQRTVKYLKMSLEIDPKQPGAERLKKMADSLDHYIHAVLVKNEYLLPYVVEKEDALWKEIKQ